MIDNWFVFKITSRIINPENPKAYYELKYIEAPFISANNLVKNTYPYTSTRYDYECSLTLDTGKKLQGQRDKYENDIKPSGIPFYFVWWFDAPHLKGIFYMNAEDVFDYWDNVGTLHNREEREGDKIAKQIKGKIYPPLLIPSIKWAWNNGWILLEYLYRTWIWKLAKMSHEKLLMMQRNSSLAKVFLCQLPCEIVL